MKLAQAAETRVFVDDFGYLKALHLMRGTCARCDDDFERWQDRTWHVLAGRDAPEVLYCSTRCAAAAARQRQRRARNLRCGFPAKVRHDSKREAEAHVRSMRSRSDERMKAYPCGDHWHVGHNTKGHGRGRIRSWSSAVKEPLT